MNISYNSQRKSSTGTKSECAKLKILFTNVVERRKSGYSKNTLNAKWVRPNCMKYKI